MVAIPECCPGSVKTNKHYRPDLYPSKWQQLFALTKHNNTQDPAVAMQVHAILGHNYATIENEWFSKDLTRIYFGFPYTFYIGTARYLNAKNWHYPFVTDVAPYLRKDEIQAYSQFWGNLIRYLKRVETRNGSLMLASLMTYGLQTLREVYAAIKTEQVQQILRHMRYLYDAQFLKTPPFRYRPILNGKSRPRTAPVCYKANGHFEKRQQWDGRNGFSSTRLKALNTLHARQMGC